MENERTILQTAWQTVVAPFRFMGRHGMKLMTLAVLVEPSHMQQTTHTRQDSVYIHAFDPTYHSDTLYTFPIQPGMSGDTLTLLPRISYDLTQIPVELIEEMGAKSSSFQTGDCHNKVLGYTKHLHMRGRNTNEHMYLASRLYELGALNFKNLPVSHQCDYGSFQFLSYGFKELAVFHSIEAARQLTLHAAGSEQHKAMLAYADRLMTGLYNVFIKAPPIPFSQDTGNAPNLLRPYAEQAVKKREQLTHTQDLRPEGVLYKIQHLLMVRFDNLEKFAQAFSAHKHANLADSSGRALYIEKMDAVFLEAYTDLARMVNVLQAHPENKNRVTKTIDRIVDEMPIIFPLALENRLEKNYGDDVGLEMRDRMRYFFVRALCSSLHEIFRTLAETPKPNLADEDEKNIPLSDYLKTLALMQKIYNTSHTELITQAGLDRFCTPEAFEAMKTSLFEALVNIHGHALNKEFYEHPFTPAYQQRVADYARLLDMAKITGQTHTHPISWLHAQYVALWEAEAWAQAQIDPLLGDNLARTSHRAWITVGTAALLNIVMLKVAVTTMRHLIRLTNASINSVKQKIIAHCYTLLLPELSVLFKVGSPRYTHDTILLDLKNLDLKPISEATLPDETQRKAYNALASNAHQKQYLLNRWVSVANDTDSMVKFKLTETNLIIIPNTRAAIAQAPLPQTVRDAFFETLPELEYALENERFTSLMAHNNKKHSQIQTFLKTVEKISASLEAYPEFKAAQQSLATIEAEIQSAQAQQRAYETATASNDRVDDIPRWEAITSLKAHINTASELLARISFDNDKLKLKRAQAVSRQAEAEHKKRQALASAEKAKQNAAKALEAARGAATETLSSFEDGILNQADQLNRYTRRAAQIMQRYDATPELSTLYKTFQESVDDEAVRTALAEYTRARADLERVLNNANTIEADTQAMLDAAETLNRSRFALHRAYTRCEDGWKNIEAAFSNIVDEGDRLLAEESDVYEDGFENDTSSDAEPIENEDIILEAEEEVVPQAIPERPVTPEPQATPDKPTYREEKRLIVETLHQEKRARDVLNTVKHDPRFLAAQHNLDLLENILKIIADNNTSMHSWCAAIQDVSKGIPSVFDTVIFGATHYCLLKVVYGLYQLSSPQNPYTFLHAWINDRNTLYAIRNHIVHAVQKYNGRNRFMNKLENATSLAQALSEAFHHDLLNLLNANTVVTPSTIKIYTLPSAPEMTSENRKGAEQNLEFCLKQIKTATLCLIQLKKMAFFAYDKFMINGIVQASMQYYVAMIGESLKRLSEHHKTHYAKILKDTHIAAIKAGLQSFAIEASGMNPRYSIFEMHRHNIAHAFSFEDAGKQFGDLPEHEDITHGYEVHQEIGALSLLDLAKTSEHLLASVQAELKTLVKPRPSRAGMHAPHATPPSLGPTNWVVDAPEYKPQ